MAYSTDLAERVRTVAARLAAAFAADQELAERLNDAQDRLMRGNDALWSGLHPDALGLLYDDTHAVGIHERATIGSRITAVMADARGAGASDEAIETVVLQAVQEIHWTIHRAFCDYQSSAEDRRQLAADVGELTVELVTALGAAGWSEERARTVNVEKLAAGEIELR